MGETASVSVLVRRKDSNKVACIINRSIFDHIERAAFSSAHRFMEHEYLDVSPFYPFVRPIKAWISLVFRAKEDEDVIDVFGIEMLFCDAGSSKGELLWLLDMLD